MYKEKCILISVNMGYGHQRAAYPLLKIGGGKLNIFGEEDFVPGWGRTLWNFTRKMYDFCSSAGRIPVIGRLFVGSLEKIEEIVPYYPVRDLSSPTLKTKVLDFVVRTSMGRDFFKHLKDENGGHEIPILSTFYTSAIGAEKHTDADVYCIICDADIHRIWVSNDPGSSRINYLVPCNSARRRLREYGVGDERIFVTGFPLPEENIGGREMNILKNDMKARMSRLDPSGFHTGYSLGKGLPITGKEDVAQNINVHPAEPITIAFAVGGAGAQKEFAEDIIKSLKPMLKSGRYRLNLVAGIRQDVYKYFVKVLSKTGMSDDNSVNIVYENNLIDYFKVFNEKLRSTDILWTKPSELSFYCGLGLPVLMAPSIGAQEDGNRKWLLSIGAGIDQEDAAYCSEWITDMIEDGTMARAAWNGYMNAPKNGIYNISDIIFSKRR